MSPEEREPRQAETPGTPRQSREAAPREAPEVAPAPVVGPVAGLFQAALPNVNMDIAQGALDDLITVDRGDLRKLLEAAKREESLAFDFLRDLCGVDYEAEGLEVVYHLYSYMHRHNVTIKTRVSPDDSVLPTASDLWRAADWHERECRDMFGVVFEGHPNLVPLLLPEDMLDHFPLRKSNPLAPLEEWQGEALGANMGSAGYIPPGSGFDVEPSKEGE